jgi:molecular chaperone DnaJ
VAAAKPNYYEVLGVPHDADEATIRRAFRARARDCNPAVSDEPEDHRRFRELAEAYGVLSRPASRLLYDRYGYRGRGSQFVAAEDDEDAPLPRGEDVYTRIELRAWEARRGTTRLMRYDAPTLCDVCDGRGVLGEPDPECAECGGTGRIGDASATSIAGILRIETCPVCGVDPCDECDGTGVVEAERRLRIRIPPGVVDGDQVGVADEGGDAGTGVPGDLVVDITVLPEPTDPAAVRYLALAGMVAAAALLVAYLFAG